MEGIHCVFGPVVANRDVDFSVRSGEIHALVGENGAGKSTLMRVLFGLVRPKAGSIHVQGKLINRMTPRRAMTLGLGMVHQHFMLVEDLSATENVFLGAEPRQGGIFFDLKEARRQLLLVAEEHGLEVDPDTAVENLAVGVRQRVEILKTLVRGADTLILDEPTAVLTPGEVDALFITLKSLRDHGRTVILITHKLDEVMAVSDKVTVMRAGSVKAVRETAATSASELARLMVGRDVVPAAARGKSLPGEEILALSDIFVRGRGRPALDKVSLVVRSGEILGIAGVDGNGQAELEDVVAGLSHPNAGTVRLGGVDVTGLSVRKRLQLGLAHIPQDRLASALVEDFTVVENFVLGRHFEPAFVKGGLLRPKAIARATAEAIADFDIRPPLPQALTGDLSGGNQQKLVASREILRRGRLLLAAHPTRGVDIAATAFLRQCLLNERDRGAGILLFSSDLSEILALSDRVAVMFRGRIVKTFDAPFPSREELGRFMVGAGE
jgi:simple sugar transport system ATP-binding protein